MLAFVDFGDQAGGLVMEVFVRKVLVCELKRTVGVDCEGVCVCICGVIQASQLSGIGSNSTDIGEHKGSLMMSLYRFIYSIEATGTR